MKLNSWFITSNPLSLRVIDKLFLNKAPIFLKIIKYRLFFSAWFILIYKKEKFFFLQYLFIQFKITFANKMYIFSKENLSDYILRNNWKFIWIIIIKSLLHRWFFTILNLSYPKTRISVCFIFKQNILDEFSIEKLEIRENKIIKISGNGENGSSKRKRDDTI